MVGTCLGLTRALSLCVDSQLDGLSHGTGFLQSLPSWQPPKAWAPRSDSSASTRPIMVVPGPAETLRDALKGPHHSMAGVSHKGGHPALHCPVSSAG